MKTHNIFSWNRFSALLLNTLKEERKAIVLYTLITGALLFVIPVAIQTIIYKSFFALTPQLADDPGFVILSLTSLGLLIIFFAKAVIAFPETKEKTKASAFLSLPATVFEKFFSRYLLYSIGLLIFTVAICVIFNFLTLATLGVYEKYISALNTKILNNMTISGTLSLFLHLIFLQAFFFIGGLYFKKDPGSKTVLLIAIFYILLYGVLSYFFSGHFFAFFKDGYFKDAPFFDWVFSSASYVLCLFIIYFRLKELEVNEI